MKKFPSFILALFSGFIFNASIPAAAQAQIFQMPAPGSAIASSLPPLPKKDMEGPVYLSDGFKSALSFAQKFSPSLYDRDRIIEELEADPYLAYRFVRDHIAFEPYAGILRGGAGTLGAQAGNGWDQSLLLQDLLNAIGIETRLRQGTLEEQSMSRLRSSMKSAPDLLLRQKIAGLDTEQTERLLARATRDWLALKDVLDTSPAVAPDMPATHIWVQGKINGLWIDFDPSFGDGKEGKVYAENPQGLKEIPETAYQRIRISVIAETINEQGALSEKAVLDQTLQSKDVQNTPVYLTFNLENTGLGGAMFANLKGNTGMVPVLYIDQDVIKGSAFSVNLGQNDETAAARDFFFGDLAKSPLTGLYMDVQILTPETSETTERKILLDQLGEKRKNETIDIAALSFSKTAQDNALAGLHQITISTGGTNPRNMAEGLAFAIEELALSVQAKQDGQDTERSTAVTDLLWPLWALNERTVMATELWPALALNKAEAQDFYIGTPRVYVFSLLLDGAEENTMTVSEIDWLVDGVSTTMPGKDDGHLWYGTLQSAFETTLIEQVPQETEGSFVESTSILAIPPLTKAAITDTLPYRIQQDLRHGYDVLVSAQSKDAWWRYDAKSGIAKAMLAPSIGGGRRGSPHAGGRGRASPSPWNYADEATPERAWHMHPSGRWSRDHPTDVPYQDPSYKPREPKKPKPPPAETCRGGTEYTILLGCVTIKISVVVGFIVNEIEDRALETATDVIRSLPSDA